MAYREIAKWEVLEVLRRVGRGERQRPMARETGHSPATHDEVRIPDGAQAIVRHPRCDDQGQRIEGSGHIDASMNSKQAARTPKGRDRLLPTLHHAEAFFEQIVQRGLPLRSATRQLAGLLDDYGREGTDAALAEVPRRGAPTPASVDLLLGQKRRQQRALPGVPILHPDRPEPRTLQVTPHELETYDALSHPDDPDDDRAFPAAACVAADAHGRRSR